MQVDAPGVNPELIKYIDENILPEYALNDQGHQIDHIRYVTRRSLNFAKTVPDLNLDIVYAVAAYHDVAHHIDAKHHEELSAKKALEDKNLLKFFSEDELKTLSEAIADHRSTMEGEPRTVYGRIVSTADRSTDLDDILYRCYSYSQRHMPDFTIAEHCAEALRHVKAKFGLHGYAAAKTYFPDPEYQSFLKASQKLVDDEVAFRECFYRVNKIDKQ